MYRSGTRDKVIQKRRVANWEFYYIGKIVHSFQAKDFNQWSFQGGNAVPIVKKQL